MLTDKQKQKMREYYKRTREHQLQKSKEKYQREKEASNNKSKMYYQNNKEALKKKIYECNKKNPEIRRKAGKKYLANPKNQIKFRERIKTRWHKRHDKSGICKDCNEQKETEWHHISYQPNLAIEVCHDCHIKRENEKRNSPKDLVEKSKVSGGKDE